MSSSSSSTSFPVGSSVLLQNLIKGASLNGKKGIVKSQLNSTSGRQEVYVFEAQKSMSIKPTNLQYETCANCSKSEEDESVNLKACTACQMVKYCNRDCQIAHRKQHKKECRKRASEIKIGTQKDDVDIIAKGVQCIKISDDKLFGDPPPKENCPICLTSMPFSNHGVCNVKKHYLPCCGKMICNGCMITAGEEMNKGNLKACCILCKMPNPRSDEEYIERIKKRMQVNNDVEAFYELGELYQTGHCGLPQNHRLALELYTKAAEVGSSRAHYSIAGTYMCGLGGVEQNKENALHHWQLAAIGGDENASHMLGMIEEGNGYTNLAEKLSNMKRAMKHFLIAARAGHDGSLEKVGEGFKAGLVTQDDYSLALREFKDSQDVMNSEQRSKAFRAQYTQHQKEDEKRDGKQEEALFKQPPIREDCLICMMPLPSLNEGTKYKACCGNIICNGCSYAPVYDQLGNVLPRICEFCRVPTPNTDAEIVERYKKRMEVDDAEAIYSLGCCINAGTRGLSQDYTKALELWHRAAKLGSMNAYHTIGGSYTTGSGVERDMKKANHYFELAAIMGNIESRFNLGIIEINDCQNLTRGFKHLMIGVRSGSNNCLKVIQELHSNGHVTKDDYARYTQQIIFYNQQ